MNLSQLYYFKKLAQVQHYTEAAKQLYISQPALSNSITSLEQELGIAIFEQDAKDKRRVKLTKYGKEFYLSVSKSLQVLDRGIELAHERAGNPSGQIDIGTIYTLQGDYLPSLMREYKQRYGKSTQFSIFQGLSIPLIEDLEAGRYEAVFCAYVFNKPEIEFIEVASQKFVAIMNPRNPLLKKDEVSCKDLKNVKDILSYPLDSPVGLEVKHLLHEQGIYNYDAQFADELTLASMVQSNLLSVGIALDTLGLAPFTSLQKRPIKEFKDVEHKIYFAFKKCSFKSRTLENFINLVKEFSLE